MRFFALSLAGVLIGSDAMTVKIQALTVEIQSYKAKIAELIDMFMQVYSRELKPLQASQVSVQQFDMFSFNVLRADHFIETETVPNVQFENVLRLSTERILSLVQNNKLHVDEVSHIQPISREVLRTLLQLIIEEVSVDKSSFHHVHTQDEINYHAKDIDNKNFSGRIDEGVVDTVVNICVLPWEDKNPMKKVEKSKPATQERNPFENQEIGMTTFGKRAIAQSALQVISQVQRLKIFWGLVKQPILYGILTNGLEWIIVAYAAGEWFHTSVINTSKVNSSTGKGVIHADGISCLAKAIRKVLLNAIEWCRRLQRTNVHTSVEDSNNYDDGGDKKSDANNDENDEGADGGGGGGPGGGDSLSRGLAKLTVTSNNASSNENSGGAKKYGYRTAFNEVPLTVQNVEKFARQNLTASHRRILELFI